MKEIWKDIVGYESLYQVSNIGRIKSLVRKNRLNELIKVSRPDKDGYMIVNLYKNGKVKLCKVHRLVAQAFISNPQNKNEVNHINCIKNDNRVENLEWTTQSENILHSYKYGGHKKMRGENNGVSRLTKKDIKDMRKLNKFHSHKELSIIFNVSREHVWKIINNLRWKHIKEDL